MIFHRRSEVFREAVESNDDKCAGKLQRIVSFSKIDENVKQSNILRTLAYPLENTATDAKKN